MKTLVLDYSIVGNKLNLKISKKTKFDLEEREEVVELNQCSKKTRINEKRNKILKIYGLVMTRDPSLLDLTFSEEMNFQYNSSDHM